MSASYEGLYCPLEAGDVNVLGRSKNELVGKIRALTRKNLDETLKRSNIFVGVSQGIFTSYSLVNCNYDIAFITSNTKNTFELFVAAK